MATMTARKVDDADYALLSQQAASHGPAISEAVRLLIADRTEKLRAAKMMLGSGQLRLAPQEFGKSPNSLDLIRAVKDEE